MKEIIYKLDGTKLTWKESLAELLATHPNAEIIEIIKESMFV